MFPLREDVIKFLKALGVTGADTAPLLDMVIRLVKTKLMNLTNQRAVPEGLKPLAVRMAAGEYLFSLKGMGQLEGFELDEAAIKQIQEGDTNTTFAIGEGSATPEQRLDALISTLTAVPMEEICRYRRLVW